MSGHTDKREDRAETARRVARLKRQVKPGTSVRWLEDCGSTETGPEEPRVCTGPVLRVNEKGPVVESHCDGEPIIVPWLYVEIAQGARRKPRRVGGKLRRAR